MATTTTAFLPAARNVAGSNGADGNGRGLRTERQITHEARHWLTQEIAYIYDAEFENVDIRAIDAAVSTARMYREPAGSRKQAPKDVPAYLASRYTIPLLTAAGERLLFQKMNFLKHLANRHRVALDSRHPNAEVVAEIRSFMEEADRVRNHLAECNLRLVVSIARRFAGGVFSFEELVSEGNMILMKAIEKFDYSRGYRFSTYATHSVQRHFYRQFRNARRRRTQEVACSHTHLSELAEVSGAPSESDQLSDAQVNEFLSQMDGELDEREHYILQERFGVGRSGDARTLQSLSKELRVSKERVRQLHHKALAKLRKALGRSFPELMTV